MPTRSRAPVEPLDAATLERLKLSPEVAWYLQSRRIGLPDCPPTIKTPEPRQLRDARFDPERVDRVLAAFNHLRHTKGKWAGRPLKPDPWQVAYILAPVFGWVRLDRDCGRWVRVVRSLYVDVPRKNGKSSMLGAIGIYMTAADGESGAEVVAAATTRDQARFVFAPVKALAEKAPALRGQVIAYKSRIVHPSSASYFEVVSSVADAQHGANIHCAVIDELHVHKSAELVEALETGTGSRDQPLIAIITTADDGRTATIYARKRRRVEQLAVRAVTDLSTYGVVWAAADTDDPHAESTWRAANPGYGISPTRSYLAKASLEAQQSPADLAKFLRLHLGIRTRQQTKYLTVASWDANAGMVDEAALKGRRAFGGLDLGSTSDLTALAWDFPDAEGGHDILWRHWAPEASLEDLNRRTAGSAAVWVREGLLTLTPGNVTDYEFIREQINRDRETFTVEAIGFDRWNATDLVNRLVDDGAPMESLGQGFAGVSAPTKELQRLLLEGTPERPRYRHSGHDLMRWQIDNFAIAMDPAGNVKPDKARAGDKIDGVAAAIIALHFASKRAPVRRSVYEDRGLDAV